MRLTAAVILMTIALSTLFLLAYGWMTRDSSYGPRQHRNYRRINVILASLAGMLMLAEVSAAGS